MGAITVTLDPPDMMVLGPRLTFDQKAQVSIALLFVDLPRKNTDYGGHHLLTVNPIVSKSSWLIFSETYRCSLYQNVHLVLG